MRDSEPTDPDWIHAQLEAAVYELRQGSLIEGVEMVEATRDQLAAALEDGPVDPLETTEEE